MVAVPEATRCSSPSATVPEQSRGRPRSWACRGVRGRPSSSAARRAPASRTAPPSSRRSPRTVPGVCCSSRRPPTERSSSMPPSVAWSPRSRCSMPEMPDAVGYRDAAGLLAGSGLLARRGSRAASRGPAAGRQGEGSRGAHRVRTCGRSCPQASARIAGSRPDEAWAVGAGEMALVALAAWYPDQELADACPDLSDADVGGGDLVLLSDKGSAFAVVGAHDPATEPFDGSFSAERRGPGQGPRGQARGAGRAARRRRPDRVRHARRRSGRTCSSWPRRTGTPREPSPRTPGGSGPRAAAVGRSVTSPSTPRSRRASISTGSLIVHTCTCTPRRWARWTNRRVTTGMPRARWGTCAAHAGEWSGTPRTRRATSEGPIEVANLGPACCLSLVSRAVEKAAAHTRSHASASATARRNGAIVSSDFTSTLKRISGHRCSASASVIGA